MLRHAGKFGLGQADLATGQLGWLVVIRQLLLQGLSLASLEYVLLLLLPVLYVFLRAHHGRFFSTLLPFLPLLILNLAAARPAMKDLVHHYSLFLVPFLALAVQQTLVPGLKGLAAYPRWLHGKVPLLVVGWSFLFFLLFSRITFFIRGFHEHWDHLGSMREAVALVRPDSALLVSNNMAPHLSHRQRLSILSPKELHRLNRYDQILIDRRHPGFKATPMLVKKMRQELKVMGGFRLLFRRDDVWLFQKVETKAR
jgi:uncharacterized membrane protein